jgi:hypothetical protein
MLRFLYLALFDSLATVDVVAGVLLVAIWFQTGYVALFRAIHGDDAGRAPVAPAALRRRAAARLSPPPDSPNSPWAR